MCGSIQDHRILCWPFEALDTLTDKQTNRLKDSKTVELIWWEKFWTWDRPSIGASCNSSNCSSCRLFRGSSAGSPMPKTNFIALHLTEFLRPLILSLLVRLHLEKIVQKIDRPSGWTANWFYCNSGAPDWRTPQLISKNSLYLFRHHVLYTTLYIDILPLEACSLSEFIWLTTHMRKPLYSWTNQLRYPQYITQIYSHRPRLGSQWDQWLCRKTECQKEEKVKDSIHE